MLEQDHIERAAQFVEQHGAALDKARMYYWLDDDTLPEEAIITFLAGQQDDGGWPAFWSAGASSIDATCYRLVQAKQMGLISLMARYPELSRAIVFLLQRQQADGHWEEDATLGEIAPLWARPGDRAATLYLTANCGLYLAMLEPQYLYDDIVIDSGLLDEETTYHGMMADSVSSYLLTALQNEARKDGTLPSFLQTQWLAACLWRLAGELVAMRRMFEVVAERLADNASPGRLVWFINTVLDAGLLANERKLVGPIVLAARERLEAAQRADGSWPSDDGPQFDVTTTLEAIRALAKTYG